MLVRTHNQKTSSANGETKEGFKFLKRKAGKAAEKTGEFVGKRLNKGWSMAAGLGKGLKKGLKKEEEEKK